MLKPSSVIPSLSLCIGALLLAGTWLLPNHYLPWSSFHSDAWIAAVLLGAALLVIVRTRGPLEWHAISVVSLIACVIPFGQWAAGLVLTSGQAFTATCYLLGFWLAIMIGARWERARSHEAMDGLFLGIAVAAVLSVGLQLHQWLELEGLVVASMGGGAARPVANVGQANLLGSLLLWGVIAGAWAWHRGYMHGGLFLVYAAFILFGVALTESRAALLNAVILVGIAWWWRSQWRRPGIAWAAFALLCVLVAWLYLTPQLRELIFGGGGEPPSSRMIASTSMNLRLAGYALFFDAIWQQPLFGYGWGQTVLAQLAVAPSHDAIGSVFGNAHNLMLDLAIWCGVPIALAILLAASWWSVKVLRRLDSAGDVLLLMALSIFAVHSMLELPFQYGFFVWPVGLFVGVLSVRTEPKSWKPGGYGVLLLLPWSMLAIALGVIGRDYLLVEENYRAWRFEVARIGLEGGPAKPPDLLILNQLHAVLWALRADSADAYTEEELGRFRIAYAVIPHLANALAYAKAAAISGQPTVARDLQLRFNKMYGDYVLGAARMEWGRLSQKHPRMAATPWPQP